MEQVRPGSEPGTDEQPHAIADATQRITEIHRYIAQLNARISEELGYARGAEQDYIRAIGEAFRAGHLTRWDLLDHYDQLRNWGIQGFSNRWRTVFPELTNRASIQRFAACTPRRPDGTWRGESGWPLPADADCPANGIYVAYALLDANGDPVLVSATKHFRERLKRNAADGKDWSSWIAVPCTDHADAHVAKRQLIAKYGMPAEADREGAQ